MPHSPFTEDVIELVRSIPEGRISTYGRIAAMAGNPRAARQVVRILHALGEREKLPWHRVVNRDGLISLPPPDGEDQRFFLEQEGVELDPEGRIDLQRFLWLPEAGECGLSA